MVLLNSRDVRVFELCRQTLQSLQGDEFALTWGCADQVSGPVDLTIWDIDGAPSLPDLPREDNGHQNILIASREQVESLRGFLPRHVAAILLKPLTNGSLRVCLDQVLAQKELTAGTAIAERDPKAETDANALLQVTLEVIMRLQEYDQDRTNFIARAIHDFRAPLTALEGYCGLLLGQQLGPLHPSEAEVLSRMRHSVERLSRMAEDMFQLTVGNRCDPKLNLQNIDVTDCIDQSVHELRPFIDEKEIQLTVDADASWRTVSADPAQIEQVLINLLDNACKFTPRFGAIEIKGYPFFWERRAMIALRPGVAERRHVSLDVPNAYRVDIRDSGPPIPAAQLSTIFEEYISCNGDQDRSGAGLGLAICKLIISRHDGRIWAESNGRGNLFSFVLPLTRNEPRSAAWNLGRNC